MLQSRKIVEKTENIEIREFRLVGRNQSVCAPRSPRDGVDDRQDPTRVGFDSFLGKIAEPQALRDPPDEVGNVSRYTPARTNTLRIAE